MLPKFPLNGDFDLNDVATILEALEKYAARPDSPTRAVRRDIFPPGYEGAGAAVIPARIPQIMEMLRTAAESATTLDRRLAAERFEAWIGDKIANQPDPMKALAAQYHLDIDQTGGGCLAYARHYQDGWYFWLTAEDGTSLPEDPDQQGCMIGAYHPTDEWWLNSSATPRQILSVLESFIAFARARFAAGQEATIATFRDVLAAAQNSGHCVPEEADAVASILAQEGPGSADTPQWLREFPRFQAEWIPDLPADFEDYSWHNDACPRFHAIMRDLVVWIDFPEPHEREVPDNPRYSVCRELDDGSMEELYSADEWQSLREFLDNYTPPPGTAPNYNTLLMLSEDAKCKDDHDWGSERQLAADKRFFDAAMQRFPDLFTDTNEDWQQAIYKATSDEIVGEAMRRIAKEVVRHNPKIAALLTPKGD